MAFAFFWIPALHPEAAQTELNAFLRNRRALGVDREFVGNGERSGWSVVVDYADAGAPATKSAPAKTSVDYREVLDPAAFERFAALRAKRKALAEQDGVPAYAVITNEQMAELARLGRATLSDLKRVPGFGQSRLKKYGRPLLEVLATGSRADTSEATGPTQQAQADAVPLAEQRGGES